MPSADEPLYLLAIIRPRPEFADAALAELRTLIAATKREPGNDYMELVFSEHDRDTWVVFEKFRSRGDWDEHMRTEHVRAGNAAMADLLREPTELHFYSPVPETHT